MKSLEVFKRSPSVLTEQMLQKGAGNNCRKSAHIICSDKSILTNAIAYLFASNRFVVPQQNGEGSGDGKTEV